MLKCATWMLPLEKLTITDIWHGLWKLPIPLLYIIVALNCNWGNQGWLNQPWCFCSDIRYTSLKLMPRFENPSAAGPEFWDKRKRGRPKRKCGRSKHKRGRYVSEAAPRFGNLRVYEPSALRKKPSDFSEKTFQFSEEAFQFAVESCHKRILERRSESRHHF